MKKKKQTRFILPMLFVILTVLLVTTGVSADRGEKKVLRVGDIGYEGFIDKQADGTYEGYGVSYLNRISQYTGWKYEYVSGTWEEILDMLERGEIDLVCTAQKTPERMERFDFSDVSIGSEKTVLYTTVGNQDIFYQDYGQMDGKTVAMFGGSFQNEEFQSYAQKHQIEYTAKMYETDQEVVNAVLNGDADMCVLGSLSIHTELKIVDSFSPQPFYIMTTKGNDRILEQLNSALEYITSSYPYFQTQLYQEYYAGKELGNGPLFTREESTYIEKAKTLTAACPENLYPLSYKDPETGQAKGILVDITRKIGEISGLKIDFMMVPMEQAEEDCLKENEADFAIGALVCRELQESEEYQASDIICSSDSFLITNTSENILEKEDYKIALMSVCERYPSLLPEELRSDQLIYLGTVEECLEAVKDGEADATLQNVYVASYYIQMPSYKKLSLSSLYSAKENSCLMLRADADRRLVSVINKSISSLNDETVNEVVSLYSLGQFYRESFLDWLYTYRYYLTAAAFLVILILGLTVKLYQKRVHVIIEHEEKEKYKKRSESDELTGLLRRRPFYRKGSDYLKKHENCDCWVIYLDIRNFKVLNDLFGAEEGDKLLKDMGDFIQRWCDEFDSLCSRFEADHFVVLTSESEERIEIFINDVCDRLTQYPLNIAIEGYCGLCFIADKETDINLWCDRAHIAAREIRDIHMKRMSFYDDFHRQRMVNEQIIVNEMENALRKRQFKVYLQPKYNMVSGEIIGAEALVRWIHPEKGMISPGEFIPVFEKNGFIGNLDFYMYEETCRLLHKWKEEGKKLLPVSVNLSRVGFYDVTLCERLCEIAEKYHVSTKLLELEVTESAYVQDSRNMMTALQKLRERGFKILMDDFGSGYSSLNMLKEAPIDEIKLDMRFLSASDPYDRAEKILGTVIAMGNEMGLSVLAEGVETREQVEMLTGDSCYKAQGFFYSRPVPVDEYEKMLDKEKLK